MFKKLIVYVVVMMCSLFMFSIGNVEAAGDPCVGADGKVATGSGAESCINSPSFTINTHTFAPGGKSKLLTGSTTQLDGSTQNTVNLILGNVIQKMITIMGVVSLLIMTIGGGYMIFHLGEESLLSRGKNIFMWGLLSLVIALSAGIIVNVITYLLY